MIINFIFADMIIYGIPNCNTVKKARTWLAENKFNPEFRDFKKNGITAEKLNEWCDTFGWEKVLNRKGTTWKKLSKEQQDGVSDQESAVQLLLQYTSAIKRPVVELNQKALLIGFDEGSYETLLK
ncbi:arsenate reductase [Pedobacter steynii]|uniref:Arsenate reductase n=2 Tax=Pedobacter steynii TaxID=430522 RepID=A0A1D7QQ12_9SPHI|nr:arsenate reductase [Pedobacter steynii]